MPSWNTPNNSEPSHVDLLEHIRDRDTFALTWTQAGGTWTDIPLGAMQWNNSSKLIARFNGSTFEAQAIGVAGGGTGATNAEDARSNLGVLEAGTNDEQARTNLQNDGRFLKSVFFGARVRLSSSASLPNNTTTTINWDTEDYDTSDIHTTSRLTVPPGASKVRLSGQAVISSNSSGNRAMYCLKNGEATDAVFSVNDSNNGLATSLNGDSGVINVTPGDYFEIGIYQNSGSTLSLISGEYQSWFSMEVIR